MSFAVSIKSVLKKHKLFFILFIVLCGLLIFYFGFNAVLAHLNLQFTKYVDYTVFSICTLLIIGLFIYSIALFSKQTKRNTLYKLCSILTGCLLCAFLIGLSIVIPVGYQPIHIVEKDGQKYIAHVTIALSTRYVKYYDYKNLLVCGKQIRIKENYQEGTKDPLKVEVGSSNTVMSAIYYDEKGTVTRCYEHPSDGIYRPY